MDTEDKTSGLLNFLANLGLEKFYPSKLTLQFFLEINKSSTQDEAVQSVKEIPWCFLRRLFKINVECRNCIQLPQNDDDEDINDDFLDNPCIADDPEDRIYPLDLIVALFLCADSFLQQEMALKMSMCQFPVPLLLPFANHSQCTLMLWALRDIVKEWCPQSESKEFVEDTVVQANIPLYSFVRLKNCGFSKSQVLNQILSPGQQNHNIFIHKEMEGGALKRKISDGLVEVCWYLPSGRKNLDIFPQPVTFANLRGDVCESLTQFSFLYQVSAATFVFLSKVEENEEKILTHLQDVKSKLFLVVNKENEKADMTSVKRIVEKLHLTKTNITLKDQSTNLAELTKKLCPVIENLMASARTTMNIVSMSDKAVELGLFVDECRTDIKYIKEAVKETIRGIQMESIPVYKNQHLPLQGDNWKKLAQLEKKQCRMENSSNSGLEEQECQLRKMQDQIKNEQTKYQLSKGMKTFIENILNCDKEKRGFFLKWLKLELDTLSRQKLSALRNKFKEEYKKKDAKLTAELDQALLISSLGIEHYMREMGLIYEFSLTSHRLGCKVSDLPGVVAEMLLDGYPLELLDGNASNIAGRWVTDVLMELHKKVGGKSRLLVLTVLGVQSTGKSTLLNTMFGVQFPVSSGRCTRGAYMLFLKVGEDLKTEQNYDFIVLIDTEGLKSPHMAQLEDSYEHDNQLATFVTGLSDVTIVNISMENSTEMKDVLQITAHAFLRMRQIGKKPVCHFVHQNVAEVSAHAKCFTEKTHLLNQLNEMTQIAAEMEKQPYIKAFTDVLDYDIEKNNWNIPGLWHGTPPMAPVNKGYSEAVADLKKNLLTMESINHSDATQIPEFLEWMRSLWKSVKYENFIFSFRNTLVAHAYDNLCKEFSQWEWDCRKEILSWQKETEVEILNFDSESEVEIWNKLVASKKSEAFDKINYQQKLIHQKLSGYYKRKDRRVNLIEKYKTDFFNSIRSLANEIEQSVAIKLDCILELKINIKKAQRLQREYRGVIEQQVMELLRQFKNSEVSDEQLKEKFEKMWTDTTSNVHGLVERDIVGCILMQLKKSFSNLKVNEELQNIDLKKHGVGKFEIKREHLHSWTEKFKKMLFGNIEKGKILNLLFGNLENVTDSFIESCTRFINDTVKANEDYHESFTRDLLEKTDQYLKHSCKEYKTNSQFEIDLKLHICGIASREFLQMHKQFLKSNDPRIKLDKYKTQYLTDFLDLYKKRDHCQRKANDFARFCIKPAVEDYINRSLGVDIVEEILTSCHSAEYSSRSYFQYNIQKELLLKEDFKKMVKYINDYENYVKDWIFQHVCEKMLENNTMRNLKNKYLEVVVKKIAETIEKASKGEDDVLLPDNKESITHFISNMHRYLIKDISFSEEDEKTILFQIQSTCHEFIKSLKISVEDLKAQLQKKISETEDISETLKKLPVNPQNELFKRVFGCGRQCPFCKVPCEAGGKEHKEHHAAVHRPQGLGRYRDVTTGKLIETLCTTDVKGQRRFKNTDTNWEFHPYKDYKKYYPEWHIPPDNTIKASDYWKYVLTYYNEQFAEEYKAKPADVPEEWKKVKREEALKGLSEAYNMNHVQV